MDQRLRGDNRNDPLARSLAEDPAIAAAIQERQQKMQDAVCEAIQSTDDRKLAAWVAVAVWEDEDGNVTQTVLGDGHSSHLEQKGFLHSGLWAAAHTE